jgi:hypothetical protein
MKKLIASLSITAVGAMGAFGLIGMGATSAFAADPTPVHTAVCTSITAQAATETTAVTAATTAASTAQTAFNTAANAESAALGIYASTLATFITDADLGNSLTADTVNFKAADTNFVATIVAWSNTRASNVTAQNTLGVATLTLNVTNALLGSINCG